MDHNHSSGPTCCQYDQAHDYNPIQYICLQDQCRENRLLCRRCVTQFHSRHKKCVIDKLVSPLDRLCMNSGYQKSQEHYMFLHEQMQSIINEWEAVSQKFFQAQQEITKGFLLQLQIYSKTFTTDQIDKAERILKNRESDIELVDNYVMMLKFLEKDYLKDVEGMKAFAEENTKRIKKMIKKVGIKVDIIMKKAIATMNQADFHNYESVKLQGGAERKLQQRTEPEEKHEEQEETKMEVEQEDHQPRRPSRIPNIAPLSAQCYFPSPPATQKPTSNRKTMTKYK